MPHPLQPFEHMLRKPKNKGPVIGLIVATDIHGNIGYKGKLLWHIDGDLKRFKDISMGNAIICGRITHESMPKEMPGRHRIVVSRDPKYLASIYNREKGIYTASCLQHALVIANSLEVEYAFVVGGARLYEEAMDVVDFAVVTLVHKPVAMCDAKIDNFSFPEEKWIVYREHTVMADPDDNGLLVPSHTFITPVRRTRPIDAPQPTIKGWMVK